MPQFTTIGWRCVGSLLLIALGTSACEAQTPSRESAKNESRSCTADAIAIAPENIEVTHITNGVWQGFTALDASCDPLVGRLYYAMDRNLLRYEIAPEMIIDQDWPLARLRTEILRALLRRMFALYGQRSSYGFATNAYPEIGERLAAASADSREWDKKTGRPYAQTAAAYAKALLNAERGYPELEQTLAEWNYSIRIDGVEKVLVRPVSEMSKAERSLVKAPVRDEDRLPVSVAIFYTIERK
jgi:hypothetical protein